MPINLNYQVLWNKYCKADDKAIDWLIKSFKMKKIDRKICYAFYEKYRLESLEYLEKCVELVKKGDWYVRN